LPHPPQDLQFRDHALQTFLDHVASKTPAPGGGSVAAVAGAMAAGLVAMTARLSSTRLMDAPTITAEADRLREIALRLADHDAIAYQDVLAARSLPEGTDLDHRRHRLREALARAADVPLELAGVAARIAGLSIRLLEEGNPSVQGDVFTAALLAVAVIRAATMLTEINVNVGVLGGDRMLQAGRYRATAAELERRIGRLEGRSEGS